MPTNIIDKELEKFDREIAGSLYTVSFTKKMRDSLLESLTTVREETIAEIKNDMYEKMSEWHGSGKAMIDDYFESLQSKLSKE